MNNNEYKEIIEKINNINQNIDVLYIYKKDCGKTKVRNEIFVNCYCKIDKNIWDARLYTILNGSGCNICAINRRKNINNIIEGINDIPTTAPWMIPYFQGGYEEAKLYTKNSHKKLVFKCPDCGRIKNKEKRISGVYTDKSIGCLCSDKMSYPEKLFFSVFEQLGLEFHTQLSKTTFEWTNKYKYDFYLISFNIIIETHGLQHYEQSNRGKTVQDIQMNDKLKEELAFNNGITKENYIVIDCRKSDLEFIKNNAINKLGKLFDLSTIDWNMAERFALSNRVKEVCEYYMGNKELETNELGKYFKLSRGVIVKYLNKGKLLGWCDYNGLEIMGKNGSIRGENSSIPIEIFKDGQSLGVFPSTAELDRISEEKFGIKLGFRGISKVVTGERKSYKGFQFKILSNK